MSTKLPTFKLVVLGGVETGKTSIVTRYVYNKFDIDRMGTSTKLDIQCKHIYVEDQKCLLQCWDIAGQERFIGLAPTYYSSTSGILMIIDITNSESINVAIKWKTDVDIKCITKPPCVLLANKWDIIDDDAKQKGITDKELDECCQKHGFCGWLSVSAKNNNNIKKSFDFLVSKVVKTKRELQKQNTIRQINPYFKICCCISNVPVIRKDIANVLLQNDSSVNNKFRGLSFSSNRRSPFGDDDSSNKQKPSINSDTVNTFGIKDFENDTNRICSIIETFKMYFIIICFPIISIIQLFDFVIYSGYFTKKWLPDDFDKTNVKQKFKWDFVGTIIGWRSGFISNNELDSRHQLVKQTICQLMERFIICFIINYCLIVQFILLYHYVDNMDNSKYFLIAFECVGPCIFWIILQLTFGIWFGYNTQLPELNDEMLYYQTLHFQYGTQTETASVLNFFLTLNQFNIHKVLNKYSARNGFINIMLIIFAAQYAAIPTIFRFIVYENNEIVPSKSLYFLWINSIILNFIYAFILLFLCCNITLHAFNGILQWYSTMTNMINYNKSIKYDTPFLSFEHHMNITAWIELRGYLQYCGSKTFNNIEIWILLYIILLIVFLSISIITATQIRIDKNTINYNCICIGSIYFGLLCIVHTILTHHLGATFHSLHLKQLKEINRQRLVLNRQILTYKNKFDSNLIDDKKIQTQIDIDDDIDDDKYDPFADDLIDVKQLSTSIINMEKSLRFLNINIDFLKHHDFTPKFFGIVKLNKLIWISVLISVLSGVVSVVFTYYLNDSL